MSADARSLARLPLTIFQNIYSANTANCDLLGPDTSIGESTIATGESTVAVSKDAAGSLREAICSKLRSFTTNLKPSVSEPIEGVKTVGDLLLLTPSVLMRALDPLLTYVECEELLRRVCRHCSPRSRTAWELVRPIVDPTSRSSFDVFHQLATGLLSLDVELCGGVRVGTITELAGRAGAAKSQLALQLCVRAARHYGRGSIYVDTEHKLSLSRLEELAEMATEFTASAPNYGNPIPIQARDVLANVTVHSPSSTDELITVLTTLDDEITLRNQEALGRTVPLSPSAPTEQTLPVSLPVGLLIVDSIAAPAKRDFGSGSVAARAATMLRCAQILKRMADEHQLVVIVINQMGTDGTRDNGVSAHQTDITHQHAALGTSWHHSVSTRILLDYTDEPLNDNNLGPPIRRQACIVKSNLVRCGRIINFQVDEQGVMDVTSDSYQMYSQTDE